MMKELTIQELMEIDGGVDWWKVGIGVVAAVALAYVAPPVAIAGGILMIISDNV